MRVGGHGARQVTECAVSWHGITIEEVADELGVTLSTARSYATHARRAGWLHAGAVPRLVDLGARWEPDWEAAKTLRGVQQRIYRRICLHYACEMPARRENLQGFSDQQVRDAVYALREKGLVQPLGVLYATEAGHRAAIANTAA